jgi:DNA-binding CsgD family transcriptional regulator
VISLPQDLLLDLYSRAEAPLDWSSVLDRVCFDLGVRSAVVQRMNRGSSDLINTTWIVRDSYSEENSKLHDEVIADARNPRMRINPMRPSLHSKLVLCDEDFSSPDDTVSKRFRESLRSIGLGNFISSGTQLPGGERLALVLHRPVDRNKGFNEQERNYVWHLAQHISQALAMGDRLREEHRRSAALGSVVDRLRFGVALCDERGELLWANNKARELLATGTALRSHGGRISAVTPGDRDLVSRLFTPGAYSGTSVLESNQATLGVHRGEPVHCVAIPLADNNLIGQASPAGKDSPRRFALFFSSPLMSPELEAESLERLLGLSPAESRVAVAICMGMSIKEYASARGLSEGTVRFQLKQVLAKTGTSRQADLVRLVFSSLAAEIIPASS